MKMVLEVVLVLFQVRKILGQVQTQAAQDQIHLQLMQTLKYSSKTGIDYMLLISHYLKMSLVSMKQTKGIFYFMVLGDPEMKQGTW